MLESAGDSVVVESFLFVAPLFKGALCSVLVLLCSTLCLLYFCNPLDGEERADCFTFIAFLMSCKC